VNIYIIGEIGINANGDLKLAHDLIKMAKACGADAVKFQKRSIETVYTPEYLAAARESPWGDTQRVQKEGLEFSETDYRKIDAFCKTEKIEWSASAWDIESLWFLEELEVPWHKIASPMLTNLGFVEAVAKCKKHTFISTGMSTWEDVDEAVSIFKYHKCPFTLMHCVSVYPCEEKDCNIRVLDEIKRRYPCVPLGYSGHEVGILPSILAVALGAKAIERHITLDRASYGSDQAASLEKRGLELLVKYCRDVHGALGDGEKRLLPEERENAKKLRYWED
jgi:N-acetylneuraminate synthase